MGVPAFFRWLSKTYPKIISNCIETKENRDSSQPNPNTEGDREFDYLYLDMNGIIHPCFHPEGIAPPRSEDEIFENVDKYILRIFNIVRPRILLYMAIDGVAPRAKMNQQRMRRFRAAKDAVFNRLQKIHNAEEAENAEELEILKDPDYLKKHDSNVITPGTGFMARLAEHLRQFIKYQQANDPGWNNIIVVLSDSSVPGEGEHKIMDFVRSQRTEEGYDPNRRHCIYGLDADLIFLGLACHEPYFYIIRENVLDVKEKNPDKEIGPDYFHFVSLWILRQYLDRDLYPRHRPLRFQWDLDRAIDDFVFLLYSAGNDFLPGVPGFSIYSGGVRLATQTYRDILPQLNDWLTENGNVNLASLKMFMERFGPNEARSVDSIVNPSDESKECEVKVNAICNVDEPVLPDDPDEKSNEKTRSRNKHDDEPPQYDFPVLREKYYREKFNLGDDWESHIPRIVAEFTRGMIWVLRYYLHGTHCWTWFYPFHYSPLASDWHYLEEATQISQFEPGKPFPPLYQLMAVLPPQSSQALPHAMGRLMVNPDSPLIQYYPTKFSVDLCGTTQMWKGVLHIPFIDEELLVNVLDTTNLGLTDEEKERNTIHTARIFLPDSVAPDDDHPSKVVISGPSVWGLLEDIKGVLPTENSSEFYYRLKTIPLTMNLSFLKPGVFLPPYCIDRGPDLTMYSTFYDKGAFNPDDVMESKIMPLQMPGIVPGASITVRKMIIDLNNMQARFQPMPPPGYPPQQNYPMPYPGMPLDHIPAMPIDNGQVMPMQGYPPQQIQYRGPPPQHQHRVPSNQQQQHHHHHHHPPPPPQQHHHQQAPPPQQQAPPPEPPKPEPPKNPYLAGNNPYLSGQGSAFSFYNQTPPQQQPPPSGSRNPYF